MPVPALPQELTDHIIDALAHDRAALQACALAARRFLPRARTHLHHTLTLRHRSFHVHPRAARPAARALLLPARAAHARVLHLRGEPSNLCFHTDADACDAPAARALFWRALVGVLAAAKSAGRRLSVRVTELYCADARAGDTRRLGAALRGGAVAHLALADCEFRSPGELRGLLAACGALHTLELGWIFWAHVPRAPAGPGVELAALAHLQVGHCARKADEGIVQLFAPARGVRRLSLGPTDLDIELLPAWVRVVGASLEHLCLSFGQIGQPEVAARAAGCLAHCPKLQRLTMSATPWDAPRAAAANPYFWVCALEVLRGALAHAQALEAVEFVWTAGDGGVCARDADALKDVDRLVAEARARDARYGRSLEVTYTHRAPQNSDGCKASKDRAALAEGSLYDVLGGGGSSSG